MSIEHIEHRDADPVLAQPRQRKRERVLPIENIGGIHSVPVVDPVERTVRSRRTANAGLRMNRRVRSARSVRTRPARTTMSSREDRIVQDSDEVFASANRYFSQRFTVDTRAPPPGLEIPPRREYNGVPFATLERMARESGPVTDWGEGQYGSEPRANLSNFRWQMTHEDPQYEGTRTGSLIELTRRLDRPVDQGDRPRREDIYTNGSGEWVIELPRAQPGEAPPFISLDELTRRVNERQDQIAERIRPIVRPVRSSRDTDAALRLYYDEGRFNTYDEHLVFMQAEEDRKAKFIAATAHFPPADENDVEHEEGKGECCCICMGKTARYISVCCAKTDKADITTHNTPFLCNACLRALVATPETHRMGCPLCRGEMIDVGEVKWVEALEAWEYMGGPLSLDKNLTSARC